MFDKKMDRREFLKVVIASAAAAGLSHFRFLNFGGAQTVLADNVGCDVAIPDYCNPGEDPDICPDPNKATSSDVCIPQMMEPDECMSDPFDPNVCDMTDMPPDLCLPAPEPTDQCEIPPGGPDTCFPQPPSTADVCPDGPGGDGDTCNETAPNANADECIPAVNESDSCSVSAEPDFCRNAEGQVVHDICNPPQDPDICIENGRNGEDICDPGAGNPDSTNALQLTAFQARSGMATLGAVAALGAAALLIPRKEK
ncbi:MAG TPA: hypothetical protein PKZ84_21190 [Anaerolineae bacterium]|nr:hypothetical protein [Anaerolineae bacterium]HQI87093.1 hypothetical protein [Anaerolineae bacterium]